MRIIGIDPGLQSLGWGVITVEGTRIAHVANGQCATRRAEPLALRLLDLSRQVADRHRGDPSKRQ